MQDFIQFLKKSPVSFFAVRALRRKFVDAGFTELSLTDPDWQVSAGGRYYLTVGDSACFAFVLPEDLSRIKAPVYRMIGAHTDQPCLRVKPSPDMRQNGYYKLNIEVYGGPIFSTWLDRPLSLAGRVTLKSDDVFEPEVRYVDLKKPVLVIPNLAIHMNHDVNKGVALDPQTDLLPVGGLAEGQDATLLMDALCAALDVQAEDILDFDLFTYTTEPPCVVGFKDEFLSAPHLDDLVMVHTAATALMAAKPQTGVNIFCGFDHEEVGSRSRMGAGSETLYILLEKLSKALGRPHLTEDLMESFMISGDVAHATHPNHPERHDPVLTTYLGKGPVIKIAAGQSYVTQSADYAVYEQICRKAGVPVQKFTNRSNARGGSTIGPIIAGRIPCRIVDMGVPILAMHSARELMAVQDHAYTRKSFVTFYNE